MTDKNARAQPLTGLSQRYDQDIQHVFELGLTAREHAAIHLRVPDSGTDWLDAMIRKSLRQEFAAKSLTGLLANANRYTDIRGFAWDSVQFADALLAEMEKEPK